MIADDHGFSTDFEGSSLFYEHLVCVHNAFPYPMLRKVVSTRINPKDFSTWAFLAIDIVQRSTCRCAIKERPMYTRELLAKHHTQARNGSAREGSIPQLDR